MMAPRWTENLLHTCLCLHPGEQVLVIVDEPLRAAGNTICAAAIESGAAAATVHVLPPMRTFSVVSQRLLQQVSGADLIVSLFSSLDLNHEAAALRAAVAAFRSGARGRWASGACIDGDILVRELTADYREVAQRAEWLGARLAEADEVRITSASGSDLTLRRGGRPVHVETGILSAPGSFGNLPGGEVFIAPLEESAEGRLVVDLCVGDLPLHEPLLLSFHRGRVVQMSGGAAASELKRRLGDDPWGWTVGELGIGANPYAQIRRRVTTDEKAAGTVHVALGSNQQFGGQNPADTHYDCVLSAPQVWLDGIPLPIGAAWPA